MCVATINRSNERDRMNPLAGDFPDDSEAEVRLLGKKEKIVDYIRDSHLPHADPNADPSTLEHANIVGNVLCNVVWPWTCSCSRK